MARIAIRGTAVSSDCAPMVGFLLVIQMPHSRDVGAVPISFCPVDCLRLCSADVENMILMVFNHIVRNRTSVRASLRTRFDVNDGHWILPFVMEMI